MAKKTDRYKDAARMLLEPLIVEAGIQHLGERQRSVDEQRMVVKATRAPHKVRWPDWWAPSDWSE